MPPAAESKDHQQSKCMCAKQSVFGVKIEFYLRWLFDILLNSVKADGACFENVGVF